MSSLSKQKKIKSLDLKVNKILNEVVEVTKEQDAKELSSITLLEPTHQRFVHMYLTGQYTMNKLAELFDVHPNTILNWVKRPDVSKAIIEVQQANNEVVTQQLQALQLKAINKLNHLINSPIDGVALQAVKDVLDRNGHRAKQEIKIDKTVRTFEEKISSLINETIDDVDYEVVDDE